MNIELAIRPQILLADLYAAIGSLDVGSFLKKVTPLVPACVREMSDGDDTSLVQALHEVDLPERGSMSAVIRPYIEVGVDDLWLLIVAALRIRGTPESSCLMHRQALNAGDYIFVEQDDFVGEGDDVDDDGAGVLARQPLAHDDRLLRPNARTLGAKVVLGPWVKERLRPPCSRDDKLVFELAAVIADRVRPTLGGAEYLAPDPDGRALAVLASTVKALLAHRACQRWHGRKRIVRVDAYRAIFEALGLGPYFEAGRRVLEVGHTNHVPVQVSIDAAAASSVNLAILNYEGGHLLVKRESSQRLGTEVSRASLG